MTSPIQVQLGSLYCVVLVFTVEDKIYMRWAASSATVRIIIDVIITNKNHNTSSHPRKLLHLSNTAGSTVLLSFSWGNERTEAQEVERLSWDRTTTANLEYWNNHQQVNYDTTKRKTTIHQ